MPAERLGVIVPKVMKAKTWCVCRHIFSFFFCVLSHHEPRGNKKTSTIDKMTTTAMKKKEKTWSVIKREESDSACVVASAPEAKKSRWAGRAASNSIRINDPQYHPLIAIFLNEKKSFHVPRSRTQKANNGNLRDFFTIWFMLGSEFWEGAKSKYFCLHSRIPQKSPVPKTVRFKSV